MMKKNIVLSVFMALAMACLTIGAQTLNVVPYPNEVEIMKGKFRVSGADFHYSAEFDEATKNIINGFAQQLSLVTGKKSHTYENEAGKGFVFIIDGTMPEEAYSLNVSKKAAVVKASSLKGVNYAIQTMKQMLPVEIFGKEKASGKKWTLRCAEINDTPRFGYRGFMLDVGRHYFDMAAIKKYLDIMEVHKLNKFHWHLTDDQGWRIEIKKYPRLAEFGSIRQDTFIGATGKYSGAPYGEGCWFSQDQIEEIIEYAAAKGIDVIPEIDLPGHMRSALASYPELGCTGGPYTVRTNWGVERDVLCAGNEKVYEFLEDVLTEVAELFPYEYIHIGGDECPKTRWEECPKCQAKIRELGLKNDGHAKAEHYLQSYMIARVAKFLEGKGKKVIGWDEILEGEIGKDVTVMSWRGTAGGEKAAKLGNDVIMSPNSHCYLDRYQDDPKTEPYSFGSYVPVDKSYSFEPYAAGMTDEEKSHILGVQANMWTEYISDTEYLEYMLHPRLAAISEVQWCSPENKDYERFRNDAKRLFDIYDILGHNYATHIFKIRDEINVNPDKRNAEVILESPVNIRYTLDGSEPTLESPLYKKPLKIRGECVLKARTERNGKILVKPYEKNFDFHKAVSRPVQVLTEPNPNDRYNCPDQLVDGIKGNLLFRSGDYVGWHKDMIGAVIDMGGEPYSSVSLSLLIDNENRIINPLNLVVYTSEDGIEYTEVARTDIPELRPEDEDGSRVYTVSFPQTEAKYLKVAADCPARMPQWHRKNREICYIFIDEIIVK